MSRYYIIVNLSFCLVFGVSTALFLPDVGPEDISGHNKHDEPTLKLIPKETHYLSPELYKQAMKDTLFRHFVRNHFKPAVELIKYVPPKQVEEKTATKLQIPHIEVTESEPEQIKIKLEGTETNIEDGDGNTEEDDNKMTTTKLQQTE